MATVSSLRSRRFANRVVEATQPFIAFSLRQVWFALPLQTVLRVVTLNSVDQNSELSSLKVTVTDPQPLKLIDVGPQIFAGLIAFSNEENAPAPQQNQYIIVIQGAQGQILGIPINSRPQLHRILPSRIILVSPFNHPTYQKLRCVSAMVEATVDVPTLLLLDVDKIEARLKY
jgi:chemotaxis signal transduction protein